MESITLPETEPNASNAKQLDLHPRCSLLVEVVTEAVTEATAAEETMATINTHEVAMDTLVVATAAAIAEAAMVAVVQTDGTETNKVAMLVEDVTMTVEAMIVEKEEIGLIRLVKM